jgi:hypothetical protein
VTETRTLTLADFLLARIAEDEEAAKEENSLFLRNHGPGALLRELDGYGLHWMTSSVTTAAHVLAESEAKRRLIAFAEGTVASMDLQIQGEWGSGPILPEHDEALRMLRILALPYADHPDYREEWRP